MNVCKFCGIDQADILLHESQCEKRPANGSSGVRTSNAMSQELRNAEHGLLIDPPNPVTFNTAVAALLKGAEEIERLTRGMNEQADVMVAREREFAAALLRIEELERFNTGLATESERRRAALEEIAWYPKRAYEIAQHALSGEPESVPETPAAPASKTVAEQQEEYRARIADGMWPDANVEDRLRLLAEIERLTSEREANTNEIHRLYDLVNHWYREASRLREAERCRMASGLSEAEICYGCDCDKSVERVERCMRERGYTVERCSDETTTKPAPTAVRFTFDAGRMEPILEWTRMPSGAYVVLAGTADNFDSLWFDCDGHHPKSELIFAQLIPQPTAKATEAMMARARSAQKASGES